MRLEIGGGIFPVGDGWVNLDTVPSADIIFDLATIPPGRLPFDDESVDGVYSSHCFEHLRDPMAVLREVARVCRLGATVEIRVPHWLSEVAFCPGHLCALAPVTMKNICHYFLQVAWGDSPRRLRQTGEHYEPSALFGELRGLYQHWSEEQVRRYAAGACHEIRYHFEVIAYGGEPGEAEAPGGSHYGRRKG